MLDHKIDRADAATAIARIDATLAAPDPRDTRIAELKKAASAQAHEIEQALGRALHYPNLKDDPKNFPGVTEDYFCVGEHVPETLAIEAARRITELEAENERLRQTAWQKTCFSRAAPRWSALPGPCIRTSRIGLRIRLISLLRRSGRRWPTGIGWIG